MFINKYFMINICVGTLQVSV